MKLPPNYHRINGSLKEVWSRNGASTRGFASRNAFSERPVRSHNHNSSGDVISGQLTAHEPPVRFPQWKRVLDLMFVVAALPLWLPLMVLVMGVIRFNSAGPIFYRQRRVGYRGRHFMLFKFRTMYLNAETLTHEEHFASLIRSESPMTKLDAAGDPRLIPGARFLRASGLDELPQIFNVLKGEMSLVGPRPCLPCEFARYELWQQRRVNVPAGLTGNWQVNGKNKTTFNQMLFLDLLYVDKMSFWFDVRIMLKTVPVLVSEMIEALKRYHSRRTSCPVGSISQAMAVIPRGNGSYQK
jgi:lipopolysaccharide/colanic/teichoic acid biosynthesis glycosyltransferase